MMDYHKPFKENRMYFTWPVPFFRVGVKKPVVVKEIRWAPLYCGAYIDYFQNEIEGISQKFIKRGISLSARRNYNEGSAEIFSADNIVVAKIQVTGECGLPNSMSVSILQFFPLKEELKDLFEGEFAIKKKIVQSSGSFHVLIRLRFYDL